MRLAITGSDGFIGCHLVEALENEPNIELILLSRQNGFDLTERDCINKANSFDKIVHLAGLSYVPDAYAQPGLFYEVNFMTTLHVLEMCRKFKAQMVFISSYIYGEPTYLPVDEKHIVNPHNPYAQSKYLGEELCKSYFRDFDIASIILRPFNIYGKGQRSQFLLSTIIEEIKAGHKKIVLKDPKPKRDYLHVRDIVNAILHCVKQKSIINEVFNIASGKSYSVMELTEIINDLLKPTCSIQFEFAEADQRKNEVNETLGSYKKIKELLGWEPTINIYDGLRELLYES